VWGKIASIRSGDPVRLSTQQIEDVAEANLPEWGWPTSTPLGNERRSKSCPPGGRCFVDVHVGGAIVVRWLAVRVVGAASGGVLAA
jgi:hypothetical protein